MVCEVFCGLCGARQGDPTSTRGKKKNKQLSHDMALKRVTELKNKATMTSSQAMIWH